MNCRTERWESAVQLRGLAELGHEHQAHSPGAARNDIADSCLSSVTVRTRHRHQIGCLVSYGVLTASVCLIAADDEATPRPQYDLRTFNTANQALHPPRQLPHAAYACAATLFAPVPSIRRQAGQAYLKGGRPSATTSIDLVKAQHGGTAQTDRRHLSATFTVDCHAGATFKVVTGTAEAMTSDKTGHGQWAIGNASIR